MPRRYGRACHPCPPPEPQGKRPTTISISKSTVCRHGYVFSSSVQSMRLSFIRLYRACGLIVSCCLCVCVCRGGRGGASKKRKGKPALNVNTIQPTTPPHDEMDEHVRFHTIHA